MTGNMKIVLVALSTLVAVVSGSRMFPLEWKKGPVIHRHGSDAVNLGRTAAGKTPPMGWNSWNHFYCSVTEDIVRQTADALVSSGLAAAGYKYVNIDDCWHADSRDAQGRLTHNPATFPSGIKALADYVHSKGLYLGIYSDAGYFTCGGKPGSLGHEEVDAATFASWDVDYLKYDNCYNNNTDVKENYHRMRRALDKVDRTIFFSMCEWGVQDPATWARGIGQSWRTTPDIVDNWDDMLGIALYNNMWAEYAGPGGWNDPDMLEVGNGGMTLSEYRVHFSLWALMKSPLLIGCDVRTMSAETRDLLANKEVIAVNQDPLGVQGKLISYVSTTQVWSGPLSNHRFVVALVNTGPDVKSISVTWRQLGLPDAARMNVRDLWKKIDLCGPIEKGVELPVGPHDVTLLMISPIGPTATQTLLDVQ